MQVVHKDSLVKDVGILLMAHVQHVQVVSIKMLAPPQQLVNHAQVATTLPLVQDLRDVKCALTDISRQKTVKRSAKSAELLVIKVKDLHVTRKAARRFVQAALQVFIKMNLLTHKIDVKNVSTAVLLNVFHLVISRQAQTVLRVLQVNINQMITIS